MIQLLRDDRRAGGRRDRRGDGVDGHADHPRRDAGHGHARTSSTSSATPSGADADQLFVELMVAHHQGGVHMAEYAATEAENAEVRDLAESIATGQQGEIVELEQRLAPPSRDGLPTVRIG